MFFSNVANSRTLPSHRHPTMYHPPTQSFNAYFSSEYHVTVNITKSNQQDAIDCEDPCE